MATTTILNELTRKQSHRISWNYSPHNIWGVAGVIGFFSAMIGLESSLATGSNSEADVLALGVIKLMQQHLKFDVELELVRYNTCL